MCVVRGGRCAVTMVEYCFTNFLIFYILIAVRIVFYQGEILDKILSYLFPTQNARTTNNLTPRHSYSNDHQVGYV